MVDYQSHFRVYALGYTPQPARIGVKSNRELYHEEGRKLFRERNNRPVHDGRHEVMKEHTDRREFETWVLAGGLEQVYHAVNELHDKNEEPQPGSKKPDKLLFKIGETGSAPGDFNFPRGVSTSMECDIYVADSLNHRIQHFNQMGIYKRQMGKLGQGNGEFNEPCDVLELPNGDIAVADRKNKRIQIFTEDFQYKSSLPVEGEPFSFGCDRDMNLAVATMNKEIFIFNVYDRKLIIRFPVGERGKSKNVPLHMSMSADSEIVVSDPCDGRVYLYTLDGRCYSHFLPQSNIAGLSVTAGAACFTSLGQILVVDTLNHTINLYTDTGEYLQQTLCPTDDLGKVNSIALGLEGHLVLTEFSLTGEHCAKVFRYRQCPCHEGKLPNSKKRSPVTSPN